MTSQRFARIAADLVRFGDFEHDPWGTNIDMLFTIAEVMYFETGEILPGFSPSPVFDHTEESLCEAFGYAADIFRSLNDGTLTHEDLRWSYRVLSRLDDILRAAGRSY